MLFTRVVLAATVCAGSVLASSSGSANIAARALHTVVKRDAADDFAAAQSIAMGLAQSAGEAVASGGKCSTECNDWVSSMGKCLTASSVSESANCVCADTAITQMGTCGDRSDCEALSKLCSEYAAELSGSSTTDDSSTTAATSTTPAAESSVTSAASSAASGASDALTSAQSAASSVASSAAADATGAPASGAGKLTVGGSAILAAGAALLVAL